MHMKSLYPKKKITYTHTHTQSILQGFTKNLDPKHFIENPLLYNTKAIAIIFFPPSTLDKFG